MPRAFANLDGLVRLSNTEGVDIRRPLVRVLTDLYVQEKTHTREEEQQYVELTLRLLPAVDAATRLAVARKLAAYAHPPAAIRDALAGETPEMAALFAQPEQDFEEVADDAGEAPAPSETPEAFAPPPTRDATASARSAAPSLSPSFAAAAPPRRMGDAFLRAASAARIDMLFRMSDADITEAESLRLPARPGVSERLELAARGRNATDFARELQLSLGISNRVAWRIVQDESGEPIVVAAKALGLAWDVLVRILLLLNPVIGHSVERVFALSRLYERITEPTVGPIVASWREEGAARPGARFQSLHAPDATDDLAARDGRIPREPAGDLVRRPAAANPRLRGQGTT